jgi:hypothetical protein
VIVDYEPKNPDKNEVIMMRGAALLLLFFLIHILIHRRISPPQ